ncbi:MAG: DEAD/DEAH box helicase [Thermoplasmata archaeon]|nr:DEAD/DEAH box helicase [Thermoplasmata archaeon]
MIEEKTVPHMTDIVKILKDESLLRSFLNFINNNNITRAEAANWLVENPKLNLNFETAKRYIGSLLTYNFLIEKKNLLRVSEYSKEFLQNKIEYPDYLLRCLSINLEWAYFLPDIYDIVISSKESLRKSSLIDKLGENGYDVSKRDNVARYLGEILPVLDKANVISYINNRITPGSRTKKDILDYARTNQRELLKILLLAERRVSKSTLRRIYRATIKAHLPLRKYRHITSKVQKEIDKIRSMKIRKQKITKIQPFESKWILKDSLYEWQKRFVELWFEKRRGIAEVVTGAGKTHLAMAIIERLKQEYEDLHVTIVVPTIVLLEQWFENLVKKLQISPDEIGLKGGGHNGSFDGKSVLIIVINSAIKNNFIGRETKDIPHNLLIVDECHRAGAAKFRNIFSAHRDWELGLSATPEREADTAYEDVLVKELGEKIGSYTYNDALEDGIIPHFDIYNYAVILTNEEKIRYERLTKEIQKILERLKFRYPQLNNPKVKMEAILKKLQKKHPKDRDLFLYFQKTKERKDALYSATNRKLLVKKILRSILSSKDKNTELQGNSPLSTISSKDRAIVFHEKIDEINSLFIDLDSVDVSIYHSGFPKSLNRIGLELYQSHQTKVLLSVKALIEGVDVPETNVGIIMASSSSQTQRIQSLGRVLRRAPGKDKTKLFVVYVRNTADERIYRRTRDWDKIIGKGNIEFRMWTEFGETKIDPPEFTSEKKYIESSFIDEKELVEGDIYPGKYEGVSFSFDSLGSLFQKTSRGRVYIENSRDLWRVFRKYKPKGGKVLINKSGHALIKVKRGDRLETIYLGNFKYILEESS